MGQVIYLPNSNCDTDSTTWYLPCTPGFSVTETQRRTDPHIAEQVNVFYGRAYVQKELEKFWWESYDA